MHNFHLPKKQLGLVAWIFALCVVGLLHASPARANCDPGDSGLNGGNSQPAGLVVATVWKHDDGTLTYVNVPFTIYDQSIGSYTPDNNYVGEWNNGSNWLGDRFGPLSAPWVEDATGKYCDGFSIFGITTKSNGYALECRNPNYPFPYPKTEGMINYQSNGTPGGFGMPAPAGATPGGYWDLNYIDMRVGYATYSGSDAANIAYGAKITAGSGYIALNNGDTNFVVLTYHEPWSGNAVLYNWGGTPMGLGTANPVPVQENQLMRFQAGYNATPGSRVGREIWSSANVFTPFVGGAGQPPGVNQAGVSNPQFIRDNYPLPGGNYLFSVNGGFAAADSIPGNQNTYCWTISNCPPSPNSYDWRYPINYDSGNGNWERWQFQFNVNAPPGTVFCVEADLEHPSGVALTPSLDQCYKVAQPIMNVSKSVNVGNGTAVAPAQPGLGFTVSASNSGDPGVNVSIQDNIPLNIDPSTAANLWVATSDGGLSPCFAGVPFFAFGALASCQINPATPSSPASATVFFPNFPSGQSMSMTWQGNVKQYSQIGVYPADYTFCANPVDWTNPVASCSDYTNPSYLQDVINFATATYNVGLLYPTATNSNITVNPIPGDISTFSKTDTCSFRSSVTGDCLYDPTNPTYNRATINLADTGFSGGPVLASNYDQDAGRPLPGAIVYSGGAGANQSGSGSLSDPQPSGPIAWTGGYSGGNTIPATWSYKIPITFNGSAGVGGTTTNCANLYVYDLTQFGHPVKSQHSSCVEFEQASTNGAFFNTRNGNVHAGDTVQAPGQTCPTSSSSINTNAGGTGTYLVTATGSLNNVPSTSGGGVAGSGLSQTVLNGGAQIGCRPDLISAANIYPTYANAPTLDQTFSGSTGVLFNARGASTYLGVTGRTVCISSQTTVHVTGNLYIDGDVYAAGTGPCPAASGSPSFGVIVDQNIYIDRSVKHLFGYYYTSGMPGSGTVFTCVKGGVVQSTTIPGASLDPTITTGCGNPLNLDGLLMARQIYFDRTSVSSGASENFAYTGQVYAAPPPAFSELFTNFGPPNALQLLPPKY